MILYRLVRYGCFLLLRLLCGISIEGRQHIPKTGPFIAAGNHVSYLDPVVLGVSVPRPLRFMAKGELFRVRFLGSFLSLIGVYPVKRDRGDVEAIKASLKMLKNGQSVGMFPGGGRAASGHFDETKLGIGMLAYHAKVPVVPVFIGGTEEVLTKHKKFKDFKPIKVFIGEPLEFRRRNGGTDRKEAYREFSGKVVESILNLKTVYESAD